MTVLSLIAISIMHVHLNMFTVENPVNPSFWIAFIFECNPFGGGNWRILAELLMRDHGVGLFKHTFSESWIEGIQGGNVLHGFMMGVVSGAGGHYINSHAKELGRFGKITANAALCGTVAEIGGGKFANGAITGAYAMMFNDMMHSIKFKDINWRKVVKHLKMLYDEYDESNNPELYKKMGGKIKSEVYDKARFRASNACALKLSIALEKVGFYIPDGTKSLKAGNGKNYFVSAGYFYEFLENVYGSNAHYYSSMNAMKARMNSGIFYQHGNWNNPDITGHIDAMYNGSAAGHIYDKQPLNVGFF